MIEVEAEIVVVDFVDDALIRASEPFVRDLREVEGRQHQYAPHVAVGGMGRELDGVREGKGAGAHEEAVWCNASVQHSVQRAPTFLYSKGEAFACGTEEKRGVAALVQKCLYVIGEGLSVRLAVRVERG
jgi:hypothetical protein